jgi:hypothetical protein
LAEAAAFLTIRANQAGPPIVACSVCPNAGFRSVRKEGGEV